MVADGMGGHQGGDIASQLIVASLAELPVRDDFDERLEGIRQCLHWLNRRMGQELTVIAGRHDSIMGSTVVALLVEGNRAACIWAGDSRCYLWRDQRLYQLSKDHSLQQQLIDEQHMSVGTGQGPSRSTCPDPRGRRGRAIDPGCAGTRGASRRCVFALQRWFVSTG